MLDLFRMEAEGQVEALTAGLLALERAPTAAGDLEACMRAAHSLKGAARIVGLAPGVAVAHAMEDCFVGAQSGALVLKRSQIDLLLHGVDLLKGIAASSEADLAAGNDAERNAIGAFVDALALTLLPARDEPAIPAAAAAAAPPAALTTATRGAATRPNAPESLAAPDRALRVSAGNLNRLLAAASESLIESRRLAPFGASLLRLKRLQRRSLQAFDGLREALPAAGRSERTELALADVGARIVELQSLLATRLVELENVERRSTAVAHRLYDEALACRMRPFADGTQHFPRMVRDLAAELGKNVRLEIAGGATLLDRDILERLEAPLGHLLRNALDHGVESPPERLAAGKPVEAVVHLEAGHSAGMLQVSLSDDGRGIDLARVRAKIVERGLAPEALAATLSEAEVLQFLFLPGFSTKREVTEISGRGVGLDVVTAMLKGVGGRARLSSVHGRGARFALALPLSLSVVRTLLVEIDGEPYALPLAHIVRTLKLPRTAIESVQGRQLFTFEGAPVGLVSMHQVLQGRESALQPQELSVIIVGEPGNAYAAVADRFLGERELVVQSLDPRLGKIENIAAGALMEDGAPVLIIDVDDLVRSVEKLVTEGRPGTVNGGSSAVAKRKRVLVVDDSLTVRELQRKLLDNAGYDVDVAVNGMDGWNAVRAQHFDLMITDVDMPRMDGIELVTLAKRDPHLKAMPVVIVSYKDREEDRRRGLDAGADYFLSKGSFHDETLLQAVVDLIGPAAA